MGTASLLHALEKCQNQSESQNLNLKKKILLTFYQVLNRYKYIVIRADGFNYLFIDQLSLSQLFCLMSDKY